MGSRTFYWVYPFILGGFYLGLKIVQKELSQEISESSKNSNSSEITPEIFNDCNLLTAFMLSLAELLFIPLLLLEKMFMVSKKNIQKAKGMYVVRNSKCSKKKLGLFGIVILIDSLSLLLNTFTKVRTIISYDLIYKAVFIIFSTLFSKLFLKLNYHRHHVLGSFIIFLFIFILTCIEFLTEELGDKIQIIILILLTIIVQVASAVQEVSEKYLMEFEFMSPFLIVGISGVIPALVYGIILFYRIIIAKQFNIYLSKPELLFSLLFAFYWFFSLGRIRTNQRYSPTHRGFAELMGVMIYLIYELLSSEENEKKQIVLYVLCFIFIWIGALIYWEFIAVPCYNLDKYVTKNIKNRLILEEKENIQESLTLLSSSKFDHTSTVDIE